MIPNNHSNTRKLINAAITGKQEIIEDILTKNIETINAADKDGNTALMHAMCCGHIEIAALILNHAKAKEILDINLINNNHDTVLMFAAIYTPSLVETIMQNYPCCIVGSNPSTTPPSPYMAPSTPSGNPERA